MQNATIRTDLFGRQVLTAMPPASLDVNSVARILEDVIPVHKTNAEEIDYLYWYYRGKQPIIGRTKEIRPEIKNIVVENRAFEIVEFKKGYEFSHPIQYTNAGLNDSAPIDTLNTYARIEGKEAKDLELAEWMYKCGTAYRICLPNKTASIDEAPYFTDALDPRYAFVVYSNAVGHKPLLSCKYVCNKVSDGLGGTKKQCVYGVYTENDFYEWTMDGETTNFTKITPITKPNTLRMNPIVEYPLNESRMGYVELCLHLFNAINNIGSNRIDAIEQFVQAIMVFINCDLPPDPDDKDKVIVPKSGDAVVVKGSQGAPADVKYIIAQLDQSQTQITKEDLLNAAYEICGVPDRKTRSGGGGDTGQAVVLRDGWGAAEARAKSTEKLFKKSELEYIKIVLRICRDTTISASEIGDLTLKDLDVRFTRNRSDNMQVKSQTLQTLLASGVNPEDSYEYCEMFSDPVAVWRKSKAYQDANRINASYEDDKNSANADVYKPNADASVKDDKNLTA